MKWPNAQHAFLWAGVSYSRWSIKTECSLRDYIQSVMTYYLK